ncbi:Hpt domain-containing protein [Methylobacterium planeticum]|uniref:Hpt domain-containing protein n=1 Tax=Methylobacterium planeticum TaxID=2615211 RepID=A0A6N6MTH2_9HYPH|nr:Hpt domain-containing protein [Methylobacterium planeticum]KAB1074701.1 Hpt domain-containing protein [Methylobacterium planeticum]
MPDQPPKGGAPAQQDAGFAPPRDAGPAPAYDPEVVAELEAVFGRARLLNLLAGLGIEIDRRLRDPEAQRDALARDAHALVSASGTLGFSALSRACAALEQACHAGTGVGPALAAARRSAEAASDAIDRLRVRAA